MAEITVERLARLVEYLNYVVGTPKGATHKNKFVLHQNGVWPGFRVVHINREGAIDYSIHEKSLDLEAMYDVLWGYIRGVEFAGALQIAAEEIKKGGGSIPLSS